MNNSSGPAVLRFSDRALLLTGRWMIAGAMVVLAVMTALIGLQVVSRNIFNLGLPWADELARFTGLMLVFFTVPLLQYHGRHIAVDLLSGRLSGVAGKLLRGVNELAFLVFCVLLLMSFYDYLSRAAHFATPAIGMPNWLFYGPSLIGVVVCTLITLLRLVKIVFGTESADNADNADNVDNAGDAESAEPSAQEVQA